MLWKRKFTLNGNRFSRDTLDGLYIGTGHEEIVFEPCAGFRPYFYFLSCPAHANLPAVHIDRARWARLASTRILPKSPRNPIN